MQVILKETSIYAATYMLRLKIWHNLKSFKYNILLYINIRWPSTKKRNLIPSLYITNTVMTPQIVSYVWKVILKRIYMKDNVYLFSCQEMCC